MGEKIVPLEINLVRYGDPVSIEKREEKLTSKKVGWNLNKYVDTVVNIMKQL